MINKKDMKIRFKEGWSFKVLIVNALVFSLIFECIFVLIIVIYQVLNNDSISILQFIVGFFQMYFFMFLPAVVIVEILILVTSQKGYGFTNGCILVASNKYIPLFGRGVFLNDIESMEYVEKIPWLYWLKKDLWKYANSYICPMFQNKNYVIKLNENYKIIQEGDIVDPPKSNAMLGQFLYRFWYGRYVVIPKHIIDAYLDENHLFPNHILQSLK